MHDVVAILLAAGGGSRFEGTTHKLLAPLPATATDPAQTVVARAVAAARAAAIGPLIVVTGATTAADLRRHLDGQPDTEASGTVASGTVASDAGAFGIEWVHNDRWAEGQMTSVQVGLERARALGARRAVIGLADQPGITPESWRSVAAADGTIAVATYDGRRGNPVALHSDVWNLLPAEGDEGARSLMRIRPDLVAEVPCEGSPHDIDTTEDLRRWQNNSSTNSP